MEAAPYLQQFLDDPPQGITAEGATRAREQLAAIKRKVAVVTVHPSVEGAQVAIDYEAVTTDSGGPLYLPPGKHTFSASHDGYDTTNVELELAAGSERRIELTLKRKSDGSGGGPVSTDDGHPMPALLGVGYGVGAALGVTSIILGVVSATHRSDADALRDALEAERGERPCAHGDPRCSEVADLREQHDDLANAALWLGVGGAATLVTTFIYHLASGDDATGAGPVSVTAGPDGGHLGARFTW